MENFTAAVSELKSEIQTQISVSNASFKEELKRIGDDMHHLKSMMLVKGIADLKSDWNSTTHNVSKILQTMERTMVSNIAKIEKQMVATVKEEQIILKNSPQSEDSQSGTDIGSRIPTIDTTSKIVRFFGNAFVRYDLSVLPADMLSPTDKECLLLTFLTQVSDGLIWIFKGQNGKTMFIFMKDGILMFAYDDRQRSPQNVRLTRPGLQSANDFRWHTLKIEKDGKKLKFFVDDQFSTEMTTRNEVQFVSSGNVFLGGTSETSTDTGGLVQKNFDGALTNVESKKIRSPSNELIIGFTEYVGGTDRTGDIIIYDPQDWNNGNWSWNITRAPPTPTHAPVELRKDKVKKEDKASRQ